LYLVDEDQRLAGNERLIGQEGQSGYEIRHVGRLGQ
jgi:hypothetical protein